MLVLNALQAILEGLNLKIFRGSIPQDPRTQQTHANAFQVSLPNCKLAAQFSLSTHLVGIFLKQNYPKYISDVLLKILEKKRTQLSDVLSQFAIFLKLGFLCFKLKIFIANFYHISPNRFWRIFSMLFNSHPIIKWS